MTMADAVLELKELKAEADGKTVLNGLSFRLEKGKRYALPNSEIMIHQPLGGAQGQASDIKIHTDHILRIRDRLNSILAENTGKPIEVIEKDTDRDNFLSANEAMEYGLIDKVIAKRI